MRQFSTKKNIVRTSGWHRAIASNPSSLFQGTIFAFIALLVSASLVLCVPVSAEAAYDNTSISSVAQVNTDASLQVTERRDFSFDEPYSALEWHISGGGDEGKINVSSVRAIQMNEEGKATGKWRSFKEVAFSPSWRQLVSETGGTTQALDSYFDHASSADSREFVTKPTSRTYSFDVTNDSLFIFPRSVVNNAAYECRYTISDAATVYDDVAELYWTYSLPVGDLDAKDIHVRIKLPVPKDAEVLPNENVFAWGHGPEGSIDIRSDGVIDITVPSVKVGQYSMAHIVFPRSWLRHVNMKSDSYRTGTRLGYALAEEDGWTDVYAAHKANSYALAIGLCVACLIALVASAILYLVYGREKAPVRSGDDSAIDKLSEKGAVCGRLLRWNRHSAYDLAYVVQGLVDKGVIQVSEPVNPDDVGKTRFRLAPSSKSVQLDEVEQGALYLLFEVIGDGYQSISVDDIKRYCAENPSLAVANMGKWQKSVSQQVEESDVFDKKSRRASRAVVCIAAIMLVLGVVSLIFGILAWGCILAFVTALLCAIIAYIIPRRSQLGVDLTDALEESGRFDEASRPSWEGPLAKAFGDALTA